MKTFRPEIQAKMDAGQITLTQCARIVRPDGKTFRVTSFNKPLTMVDTGEVYQSVGGYQPTATEAGAAFTPGTVDVQGLLVALDIDRIDIRAGQFSGSRIYIFETDYTDPHDDDIKRMSGFWGEVTIRNGYFVTEFIGLKDILNVTAGKTIQAGCPADLFDTDCKVQRLPGLWTATTPYTERNETDATDGSMIRPTTENGWHYICTVAGTSGGTEPVWPTVLGATIVDGTVTWETVYGYTRTLTVTSVVSNKEFSFGATDFPDDWFNGGYLIDQTGNNINVTAKEILDFTGATGEVVLITAFPFSVEVGDVFELTAGCRKRFNEDCIAKFNNEVNFQGFPHVPTSDRALKFGGQP